MGGIDGEWATQTDVLVIGSGFGGSVVAAELAAAGVSVCVVERGKRYPPGSFPRGGKATARNFWDPSEGLHGLFDVWTFDGLEAVTASGLGGGSLIYANVLLPAPESSFHQPHPDGSGATEHWPFSAADLAPHYAAVRAVLDPQLLPDPENPPPGAPPVDAAYGLTKTTAFLGAGARRAPLGVQFRGADGNAVIGAQVPDPGYPNVFGAIPRRTCRLCGECDLGCNEGAKNSMDHTYLSRAVADNASVHTRAEVTAIEARDGGGFDVRIRTYTPEQERTDDWPEPRGWWPRRKSKHTPPPAPERVIFARRVVLAAGALGSTFLLLRNRDKLKLTNPRLGSRFCGNGDLLGFILGATAELTGWRGPVITSYRDYGDGMHIQDAGYPEFAAWLTDTVASLRRLPTMARVIVGEGIGRLLNRSDSSLSKELSELLGPARTATHGLPVLGMGPDVADGKLYLRKGRLENTWNTASSAAYFSLLKSRMEELAEALGGRLTLNPTYHYRRVITVHPLGGCPADTLTKSGELSTPGVVDGFGRVRGVPGLWVCDGAAFPGPIGANPSLTIAAFAHRAAATMIAEPTPTDSWPVVL
ncbi:GMC oxidoreductase [Mycolicibacterium brumae]|uniref:Cholesterol oxidase n=1 Tax=Mycolicibacterium brumae TaxID=85968 RepID=A0A2G5P646_9MYCO|nr:GMC oxidoreductase [Mycolicibacterium brumae]MCV7193757.1 GMC family oxidoreductase [Mycolicibacterium brumae]PIB73841.1 GMC family oxidoreductase [Mycolicibacterium brumae]RWA19030.1 hypothetical protein MBRU_17390 [Mycolicibacterium brumae DSM 44177]UWW08460.1 GMC oxidoreductase [Mycolicibacterium brumae]